MTNVNTTFTGSSLSLVEDPNSPFFLHHSDNHGSVAVTPLLDAHNFHIWSRNFLLALSIRNKTGFVDGSLPKPHRDDPSFMAWMRCNSLIVAWLFKSLTPAIAATVFYMSDACKIWNVLKNRFEQPDDVRICSLQQSYCSVQQGNRSVHDYFNELHAIWEELRCYRPPPHCICGNCSDSCFQESVMMSEKDYIYRFLNGLNESYSNQRSQILLMKPFPSLDEAVNIVSREESHRSNAIKNHPLPEASAMAINASVPNFKKRITSSVVCSYCGRSGHLKRQCYKLHGGPSQTNAGATGQYSSQHYKRDNSRTNSGSGVRGIGSSFSGQVYGGVSGISAGQSMGNVHLSQSQVTRLMALLADNSSQAPVHAAPQVAAHVTHSVFEGSPLQTNVTIPGINSGSGLDNQKTNELSTRGDFYLQNDWAC